MNTSRLNMNHFTEVHTSPYGRVTVWHPTHDIAMAWATAYLGRQWGIVGRHTVTVGTLKADGKHYTHATVDRILAAIPGAAPVVPPKVPEPEPEKRLTAHSWYSKTHNAWFHKVYIPGHDPVRTMNTDPDGWREVAAQLLGNLGIARMAADAYIVPNKRGL